jgi:hypothetical protein
MLEGRLGENVGLVGGGAKSHRSSGRAFNCTREEAIRREE